MSYLRTSEAAELLHISPNTLRAWERRFGFPMPQRTGGGHRMYSYGEIQGLADSITAGLSIASAMARARDGSSANSDSLYAGLLRFDRGRADNAMETSIAVRSIERSVVEVLLPALDQIWNTWSVESARWTFAAQWANDWLRRISPHARTGWLGSIVLGDACGGDLDPDSAYVRGLELSCTRAGLDVLTLSVHGPRDIEAAIGQARPSAIVIAGEEAGDDAIARWAYAACRAAGSAPIALYRRGEERRRLRTAGAVLLPEAIAVARETIVKLVTPNGGWAARRAGRTAEHPLDTAV